MRVKATSPTLVPVLAIVLVCSATPLAAQTKMFTPAAIAARADEAAREDGQRVITLRQSDSLLNGALIGAGVAIAAQLFVCTRMEPWSNCRDDVGPMLKIGAIGAGIGIVIDALIHERKTVTRGGNESGRLHAAPIVSRDAKGVQFALSF